jgi:2-hydroxyacyl-CoA lyase 1
VPVTRSQGFTGNDLIAQSLKQQGVEFVFGIVGYPVQQLAEAIQRSGIKYIGMRNEQAASYAAAAVGYLTGRPGGVMTVTGPGVIHAVAGMANAKENCWPMISIGGSHETDQKGLGAFQENIGLGSGLDYVRPATKYCTLVDKADRIPFFVEQAVRASINGRPGAVHLDVPADIMRVVVDPAEITQPKMCPDPRIQLCAKEDIDAAVALLRGAKSPLVIIGKGAAYACCGGANGVLAQLVEACNFPFLPTPMGKGTLPDDHPNCVAPARSTALGGADVVLLVGARLNWILHFGQPPRYQAGCKFIKVGTQSTTPPTVVVVFTSVLSTSKFWFP